MFHVWLIKLWCFIFIFLYKIVPFVELKSIHTIWNILRNMSAIAILKVAHAGQHLARLLSLSIFNVSNCNITINFHFFQFHLIFYIKPFNSNPHIWLISKHPISANYPFSNLWVHRSVRGPCSLKIKNLLKGKV